MRNWKIKISDHISYTEATKSNKAIQLGLENSPDKATLERMRYVAKEIFEPLREHFGIPIAVTSFYRSKAVNKAIGGSSTSEHVYGSAIDIDADVIGLITNRQIFNWIKENCEFNQLIWEFGSNREPAWIHVSCKKSGNKNEILKSYKEKNIFGRSVTKYKRLN